MSLSMYQASIPNFVRTLSSLSTILDKATAYAADKKIDDSVLVNARLAPDMFPLSRQIQIATDAVKGCAARLSGSEMPSYPDTESTMAELQARIAKTIAYLQSFDAGKIDGSEAKTINMKAGPNELTFTGQDYLTSFVIPNLYFHASMTYAILRHNGVDIGKMDYLGAIQPQAAQQAA